jgi:hypothetical protein
VLSVAVAWRTENHRGLSHVLAGMDLRIGDDESEDPTIETVREGV